MTIENFESRFTPPLDESGRQQLKIELNARWALDHGYKGGYVDGSGFQPLNEAHGPAIDVNSLYPAGWSDSLPDPNSTPRPNPELRPHGDHFDPFVFIHDPSSGWVRVGAFGMSREQAQAWIERNL